MIQLTVRLRPRTGRQDLAWLRRAVDDIHDIYAFLLQAQAEMAMQDGEQVPAEPERATVAAGMVAQEGTPIVRMRDGSVILEMAQLLDQTLGVQALVAVGLLFKKGPEIAAWPGRLRKAWYSSKEEALRARDAYERLARQTVVDVVEESPPAAESAGADECADDEATTEPAGADAPNGAPSTRPRARSRSPQR